MNALSILAVDDEPLALRRLQIVLDQVPDATLVGTARNGRQALAKLVETRPDVLLLDIRMHGMDGFDVLEALPADARPFVIFVTAYDAFAARAFDYEAVDYVLKPVSFDRLTMALERARRAIAARAAPASIEELRELIGNLRAGQHEASPRPRYEEEIWVEQNGAFVRVAVSAIRWAEAERDYVRLHTRNARYFFRESLTGIGERLDPEQFIRIRRSALVRISEIRGIRTVGYGDVRVELEGESLRVGRTYLKAVRRLISGQQA
jgi:DNA-binding LytR/AlgR family response regulator